MVRDLGKAWCLEGRGRLLQFCIDHAADCLHPDLVDLVQEQDLEELGSWDQWLVWWILAVSLGDCAGTIHTDKITVMWPDFNNYASFWPLAGIVACLILDWDLIASLER